MRRSNPEFACWERRVRAVLGNPMPGKGRLLSYAKQLGDVPPPILTSAKSVRYPYVGADPENPDRLICGWCSAARDSWKRGKYNKDDEVGHERKPNLPAIDGACFLCSLREAAAGKDVEWSPAGTVVFLSFSPATPSEA